MAYQHGKATVITVATKDISAFSNTSEITRGADVHDTSCYGTDDKTKQGGLRESSFTCGGIYDNTLATSPRGAMVAVVGNTLAVVRKPEGTGTGKPQEAFNAVLSEYKETNPVADMVAWSASFEISGAITVTVQS